VHFQGKDACALADKLPVPPFPNTLSEVIRKATITCSLSLWERVRVRVLAAEVGVLVCVFC